MCTRTRGPLHEGMLVAVLGVCRSDSDLDFSHPVDWPGPRARPPGYTMGCGPSKRDKDAIKPPTSEAGLKWKYNWPKGADASGPLTEKGIRSRIEKALEAHKVDAIATLVKALGLGYLLPAGLV